MMLSIVTQVVGLWCHLAVAAPAPVSVTPEQEKQFRQEVVAYAENYIGTRYRSGGISQETGFDCSGFVNHVLSNFQVELPRSSKSLSIFGESIHMDLLRPGDLVFFQKKGRVFHVAMVHDVTDEGIVHVIHSTSSRGVVIEELTHSDYWSPKIAGATNVISEMLVRP